MSDYYDKSKRRERVEERWRSSDDEIEQEERKTPYYLVMDIMISGCRDISGTPWGNFFQIWPKKTLFWPLFNIITQKQGGDDCDYISHLVGYWIGDTNLRCHLETVVIV